MDLSGSLSFNDSVAVLDEESQPMTPPAQWIWWIRAANRCFRPIITFVLVIAGSSSMAADEPLSVDAFAQLPLVSGGDLSPDGNHFAYFRPIDGRRFLVVQPVRSGGKPYVVPPPADLEFSWLRWANEERIVFALAFSGQRGRTETTETRLLSMRFDATDLVELVKPGRRKRSSIRDGSAILPAPQIQDDVIDWLPSEPDFILVSLDEDFNARDEVRKIDVRTGDHEIVRRDTRGIQRWITDQDHAIRIGYGYDPINGFTMTMRHPDGSWASIDNENWMQDGFTPQAFTADPNVVLVFGPDARGIETVSKLSIETGEVVETVFAHETVDASGLVYDPVSGHPVGVSYIDDFPRVRYFDEVFQGLQRSLDRALPDTVNRITSMSDDRRQVLVHSFSDTTPGNYFYWDRDAGRTSFIAETMPGLLPEQLSSVESRWIEAPGDVRFEAFLTLPRGVEPQSLPAVILPHGGPASRDDRQFSYLPQFLASRGYAVLQPNFRGSTGYGYAFENAGRQQWGGLMQEDVATATRWLSAEGIADPERICIVGASYGGYAAAMGLIQTPELYRCGVSINGVLNLPRLIADDQQYIGGSEWTKHIGLDEARASDVSPYHQAERIEDPILVIQAEDDTRVHADQGQGFSKRLERLDKDVEYVEVEFGGHSLTNEAARRVVLSRLEAFLGEHLAP
jgi:dipeptidyl aminopeptidase/acylaminoacyl peptidase